MLVLPVWGFTGWLWSRAVLASVRARQNVALDADFDRVRVDVQPLGTRVDLPLLGLEVAVNQDSLELTSGDQSWTGSCAPSPERDELVETLRTMAERATPALAVETPDALSQLRGVTE